MAKLKRRIAALLVAILLATTPHLTAQDYDIGSGGNSYQESCYAGNYLWLQLLGTSAVIAGLALYLQHIEWDNDAAHPGNGNGGGGGHAHP